MPELKKPPFGGLISIFKKLTISPPLQIQSSAQGSNLVIQVLEALPCTVDTKRKFTQRPGLLDFQSCDLLKQWTVMLGTALRIGHGPCRSIPHMLGIRALWDFNIGTNPISLVVISCRIEIRPHDHHPL